MDDHRNEVHITLANNGHRMSTDCWCEPRNIAWYRNKFGILVLVVEHDDTTLDHHALVLQQRELQKLQSDDESPDSPWVSRVLDNPSAHVPRKPHKENHQ